MMNHTIHPAARSADSVGNVDTPVSPTSASDRQRSMTERVCEIESGKTACAVLRSASRDSQVRPTAQRSGRCPIGVRRFKSCSLHSDFSQEHYYEQ